MPYFNVHNYAKIIGTEDIVHIGSANFSNESADNIEMGILIEDRDFISKLYSEFFDKVSSGVISYLDDNFNAFHLFLLSLYEIIDKIVEKVIELDNNDSAYLKMLETPAFLNQNYVEEKQAELIRFLYNIFDQPIEKAFRRNRFYWGERYERRQKIGEKFYWEFRKLIPVRDALHKIVKR